MPSSRTSAAATTTSPPTSRSNTGSASPSTTLHSPSEPDKRPDHVLASTEMAQRNSATAVSSCTSPRRVFRGSSRPHRVGSAARRDRCAGDGIYHRRAAAEGDGNRLRRRLRRGGGGGFGGAGPEFGEPAPGG